MRSLTSWRRDSRWASAPATAATVAIPAPTPVARPQRAAINTQSAAKRAIELVCEQLEMTNPRRPRFVYCHETRDEIDAVTDDVEEGMAELFGGIIH